MCFPERLALYRRLLFLLAVCWLSVLLAACSRGKAAPAAAASGGAYVTLEPDLARLREDFNADADKVRLLYIVGATCPECLRGMDDLGKALAGHDNDPRLHTYIVYVPALGATAADIQATVALIPGSHVSRYWDPAGASGKLYDEVLKTGGFAWDVWMIYAPGARWQDVPPPPAFWMDQLDGLPRERFLDSGVFAEQVQTYLEPRK